MLKKNQLVLILLTLVLMLSVYFIRAPFKDKEKPVINNQEESVGRLEQLQAMRVTLNDERASQVLSLDAIIASSDKTVVEKENAIGEKRHLNALTEKELLLEVAIMNKGYQDAFVHATDVGLDITVVSNATSLTIANEIIVMALNCFDSLSITDVSVNFQTAAEVMATSLQLDNLQNE